MKKHLIYLLFVLLVIPLFSSTLEEEVNIILENGIMMDKNGDTVFMSATYSSEAYQSESEAYSYLNDVAYDFFMIQAGWDEISDEEKTAAINEVDYIAVPYATDDDVFILYVSMNDLVNEYNYDDYYYDYDADELYYEFGDYIEYMAEITSLSAY